MPRPEQSERLRKLWSFIETNMPALVIPMKKKTHATSSTGTGAESSQNSPAPVFSAVSKVATSAADDSTGVTESTAARWTFLSNHSHVLILISRNPDVVLRHVAIRVGITERAVQRIIADLEEAGILEREKVGRQNHYRIISNKPLRHSIESHRTIADLLSLMDVSIN